MRCSGRGIQDESLAAELCVRRTIPVTYQAWRHQFATALEGAAEAHERGDVAMIDAGYDEIDAILPRGAGPEYDKLHLALHFWDSWADARNHEWRYYDGIDEGDWPILARGIAADLRANRGIQERRVLAHFDTRHSPRAPLPRGYAADGPSNKEMKRTKPFDR
jgi:hypothetical protein